MRLHMDYSYGGFREEPSRAEDKFLGEVYRLTRNLKMPVFREQKGSSVHRKSYSLAIFCLRKLQTDLRFHNEDKNRLSGDMVVNTS